MYNLNLDISYFPSQKNAEIFEITVGDLLRKVANDNPNLVAMIDILENGHDTNTFFVLRMATHVPIVINLLIPLGKLDKLNCIQCICTV